MTSLFTILTCLLLMAAMILHRRRRPAVDPLPPQPTSHPRLTLLRGNEKPLPTDVDRDSDDIILTLVA